MIMRFSYAESFEQPDNFVLARRKRFQDTLNQAFVSRICGWTARIIKETAIDFKVVFLHPNGASYGPALISGMDSAEDAKSLTAFLPWHR